MIPFYDLLREMKNSPEYSIYYDVSSKFVNYLHQVDSLKILPRGQYSGGYLTELEGDKSFPAVHRYGETWFKALLSKMYLLDEWYQEEKPSYTFLTAMVSSKDRTIWDTFELITKARENLIKLLRNRIFKEKFDYIWFVRPHENGVTGLSQGGHPHLHMIIFKKIGLDDQIRLRNLWEKKCLGSFERGLDFDVTENKESIRSMRNYCISYLTDSFIQTTSKYGQPEWNLGLLAFNAVALDKLKPEPVDFVHKNSRIKKCRCPYRFWGSSRKLSNIMKYDPDKAFGGDEFSSVFDPEDYEPPLTEEEIAEMTPETFEILAVDKADNVKLGTIWRVDTEKLEKVAEKWEKYKAEAEKTSLFFSGF
jgi:hypothetical protein